MAAWRAHASPCRQPRLGFCTGCRDTALVALVTLPTVGVLCLGPTGNKISPLWLKSKRQVSGQSCLGCPKSKNTSERRRHPPSWAREHRGAALGFCILCVYGFSGNGTIPAINNGLMRSFIWALNVYYIHAFVPHFAQFL